MGTRNLTAVYVDGEYRIAQYGQWDGYPDGQGMTCLGFVRDDMDEKLFRERLKEVRFLTKEEIGELYKKYGEDEQGMIRLIDYDVLVRDHPGLSRDYGAKILYEVQQGKVKELSNAAPFAAEGMWCEWAYVIDLDKRTFEVFSGCTRFPLQPGERFYEYHHMESDGYGGVHLRKSWNLDELPSNEEFLKAFAYECEEEP